MYSRRRRVLRRSTALFKCKVNGKKKESAFLRAFKPAVERAMLNQDATPVPDLPLNHLPPGDVGIDGEPCSSNMDNLNCTTRESYEVERAKLSTRWRGLEKALLQYAVNSYQPQYYFCTFCKEEKDDGLIRCEDCGSNFMYCMDCYDSIHKTAWFHRPNIWQKETGTFVKLEEDIKTLSRPDDHCRSCETIYCRVLTVVDGKGFQHRTEIEFCKCETEFETLYRHSLWPCSPVLPKVCVKFELMELLRVFSLDQQVSIEGFCSALSMRYHAVDAKNIWIKDLSKILLNETIEAYRHHVHQLQNVLPSMLNVVDDGRACPICSGNSRCADGFCLDGNFGLVRKASSGKKSAAPRHDKHFFFDDLEVDQFLQQHSEASRSLRSCSDFKASSEIRSKSKNAKLDVKGVFGSCCKHEFPKYFVNMKHGERLGYAVFMIKKILEENGNSNINIFYDIACKLYDHLLVSGSSDCEEILKRTTLAVPVFHGYGHNMSCQINFSPRRKEGFGLTEGETVERLWSYLRKFAPVTKEMKPEHRTDLLNDALHHYSLKLRNKLDSFLIARLRRAESCLTNATTELDAMISAHPGSVTMSQVEIAAKYQSTENADDSVPSLSVMEQYALNLRDLNGLRKEMTSLRQTEQEKEACELAGKIAKLERQIHLAEVREKLSSATLDSQTLADALTEAVTKKRKVFSGKLRKLNVERLFLCKLIKKYPHGQSVPERICKNIKRVTNSMRKLIASYNVMGEVETSGLPSLVSLKDFCSATTTADYEDLNQKLIQTFFLYERAREEVQFAKNDMESAILFFKNKRKALEKLREDNSSLAAYLTACLIKTMATLEKLQKASSSVNAGCNVDSSDTEEFDQGYVQSWNYEVELEDSEWTDDE